MAFCFLHERGVGDCTCNPPSPSSQNVSPPIQKPKRTYRKKLPGWKAPTLRKEELFPSDEEDGRPKDLPKEAPKHHQQEEAEQRSTGELQLPGSEPGSGAQSNGKRPRHVSTMEADRPYLRYGPYYGLCEKCADNLLAWHTGAR